MVDPTVENIWGQYSEGRDLDVLRDELATRPSFMRPSDASDSLLKRAILASDLPAASLLLELGEDPNLPASDGFTLLHQAVDALKDARNDAERAASLAILKSLLEHGADPNIFGADGATAFHRAVGAGVIAAAELMIEHGADLDLCTLVDDEPSPLTYAALMNQPAMFRFLSHARPRRTPR